MSDHGIRVLTSPDEIVMGPVKQLHDYWLSLKGEQDAPLPTQFDVLSIPDLVPLLARITRSPETDEWRVRFQGQDSVILVGTDTTGRTSEIQDDDTFGQRSVAIMALVNETGKPVINGPANLQVEGRDYLTIQSLAVPFVEGGQVTEIIAVMAIEGEPEI